MLLRTVPSAELTDLRRCSRIFADSIAVRAYSEAPATGRRDHQCRSGRERRSDRRPVGRGAPLDPRLAEPGIDRAGQQRLSRGAHVFCRVRQADLGRRHIGRPPPRTGLAPAGHLGGEECDSRPAPRAGRLAQPLVRPCRPTVRLVAQERSPVITCSTTWSDCALRRLPAGEVVDRLPTRGGTSRPRSCHHRGPQVHRHERPSRRPSAATPIRSSGRRSSPLARPQQ
jgi:hypothetical protein